MKNLWIVPALMMFVYACGTDGSGVSGSKQLTALNAAEAADVCEYIADVVGPERTVMCADNVTVTYGFDAEDLADCKADLSSIGTAKPNCTATVGQAETCFEALAKMDPCLDEALPASCAIVFSAACVGD